MKQLSFADLQERNIVTNRVTLKRWQDQLGFPRGFLIGPNSRRFPEDEVQAWLAARAAASKAA